MEHNKYFETGSNPYYLNINNTTKEISNNEATNSSNSLIDLLNNCTVIQDEYKVEPVLIEE